MAALARGGEAPFIHTITFSLLDLSSYLTDEESRPREVKPLF